MPGTKCLLCEQEGPAGRERWGVAATDRTKLWVKWQVTLTAGEAAVMPGLPTGCAGHFCATCSLILRGELWLSSKLRGMEAKSEGGLSNIMVTNYMPPVTREGQPWIQVYGPIPAVELLLLYFMENQPSVSLQIGKFSNIHFLKIPWYYY